MLVEPAWRWIPLSAPCHWSWGCPVSEEELHRIQLTIYLARVLCLSVCDSVCVTFAERTAILLVLVIKLTKETRRRAWRGRDRDGEIRKGQIEEGGYEETYHCLNQTWETCRFTVPPGVTPLLNYISCGILWRIFCQTGILAGFSLHIINFVGSISEAAMKGEEDIILYYINLEPRGRIHPHPHTVIFAGFF